MAEDVDLPSPVPVTDLHPRSVNRLAELVADLCGCATPVALAAVSRATGSEPPASADEALAVVARAMVHVRHDTARHEH